MAHERQDIRDAVVRALSGHTPAGTRVYRSRMGPPREADLPCICVYVDTETVDETPTSTGELTRTIDLQIEGYAAVVHAADIEAALDDLALAIETAVDVADTFENTTDQVQMSGTVLGLTADGQRPMGVARLTYEVTYRTDLRIADVPDDFDTVDVRYSLSGTQAPADRAEDLIDGIHV